uniref:Si:rp71-17i16.6 n=1 Tax=Astyanax mexicanus TaxID=7994 RepID=A0A3B1IY30_ASTMX
MFGESTAEYFLNLSSLRQNTPAWYTHMRDNMKAVALWDALRQRSAQIMKEKETKPTDWKKLMREDHLHRISAIRQMFRSAQRNQAYTALLLQHRP